MLIMGKNFLSWVLFICAIAVAYSYVSDYLDQKVTNNFSTPTVVEINKQARSEGLADVEYQL